MRTDIIRSLHTITPNLQGVVLTIGNFDGVHLGHQALLAKLVKEAKSRGVPSLVMTFEPHPAEFFGIQKPSVPRLTRFREKFCLLHECGVDHIVVLPFNQRLAQLTASDFVHQVIVSALHPSHILIGDDFRFGHKRQGDFALLQTLGAQVGFSVEAMPTTLINNERVSSTRVRQTLAAGDFAEAERLLGRPYALLGKVRQGDQRGRQLGFPTANIFLHRKLAPVQGVYTVYLRDLEQAGRPAWPGVANVGSRPTVDGTRTILEVHLLDFNEDIYRHRVEVEFCGKLRDEMRYPNLECLVAQIGKDVAAARAYFREKNR